MSNDEKNIDEVQPGDEDPDETLEDDLFDDDSVDEVLPENDAESPADGDSDDDSDDDSDSETESDTEALDDLEAEELEMLTEDEASETIVVDEATQLRDIRRAQMSIEASSAGGVTDGEFVCSVCFLVKKANQVSNRRKKICLDCAN